MPESFRGSAGGVWWAGWHSGPLVTPTTKTGPFVTEYICFKSLFDILWKWKCWSLSFRSNSATPWTATHQALSVGFPRQDSILSSNISFILGFPAEGDSTSRTIYLQYPYGEGCFVLNSADGNSFSYFFFTLMSVSSRAGSWSLHQLWAPAWSRGCLWKDMDSFHIFLQ